MALIVPLALVLLTHAVPPKKPAPPARGVMGTKQLDRTKADLGQVFSVGSTSNALNYRLVEARYSMRESLGNEIFFAKDDEKLLVLKVEIQNPLKTAQHLDSYSFHYKTVAPDNQNREQTQNLSDVATSRIYDQDLQPAQKVVCYQVLTVHAAGPVFKMWVERDEDRLAYDLRGKAGALAGPWAKTADTPANEIEFKLGDTIPVNEWDLKLESIVPAVPAVQADADGNGAKDAIPVTIVGTMTLRSPVNAHLDGYAFHQDWGNSDGETADSVTMLRGSAEEDVDANVRPGTTFKIRIRPTGSLSGVPTSVTIVNGARRAKLTLP